MQIVLWQSSRHFGWIVLRSIYFKSIGKIIGKILYSVTKRVFHWPESGCKTVSSYRLSFGLVTRQAIHKLASDHLKGTTQVTQCLLCSPLLCVTQCNHDMQTAFKGRNVVLYTLFCLALDLNGSRHYSDVTMQGSSSEVLLA
jgi:hypothetical protein